jgi:2-polyprenyl-3-methyl-5-hydroxy-6-metoxy-1,4-benzoquinol methylase
MDEIAKTRGFFNRKRAINKISSPLQTYVYEKTRDAIPRLGRDFDALDIGCHWGRYTKFLASTCRMVWGVDYSEVALESAEKSKNINYVCLDVDVNGEGLHKIIPRVDLIIAICIFEMLRHPDLLVAHLYGMIKPGGKLFVVIPNRYSLNYLSLRSGLWFFKNILKKGPYIWNNGITKNKLKSYLLKSGFEIEEEKMIIGIPVYLIDRLPMGIQLAFIKLDPLFKFCFGGGYYCVIAKRNS